MISLTPSPKKLGKGKQNTIIIQVENYIFLPTSAISFEQMKQEKSNNLKMTEKNVLDK